MSRIERLRTASRVMSANQLHRLLDKSHVSDVLYLHQCPMSRIFAYCSVSTIDQTPVNQAREIATAGFTVEPARVISETVSSSVVSSERKGFTKLLHKLEGEDVLVVTKLDRLGHSMHLRATVEALTRMGLQVHCLALGGVDLASASGKDDDGRHRCCGRIRARLAGKAHSAQLRQGEGRGEDAGTTIEAFSLPDRRGWPTYHTRGGSCSNCPGHGHQPSDDYESPGQLEGLKRSEGFGLRKLPVEQVEQGAQVSGDVKAP